MDLSPRLVLEVALRELCRAVSSKMATLQCANASRSSRAGSVRKSVLAMGYECEDGIFVLRRGPEGVLCVPPDRETGSLVNWRIALRTTNMLSAFLPLLWFASEQDDGETSRGRLSPEAITVLIRTIETTAALMFAQSFADATRNLPVNTLQAGEVVTAGRDILRSVYGPANFALNGLSCISLDDVQQAGEPIESGRLTRNGEWGCQFSDGDSSFSVSCPGAGSPRWRTGQVVFARPLLPEAWIVPAELCSSGVISRPISVSGNLTVNRRTMRAEWKIVRRSASTLATLTIDASTGEMTSITRRP